MIPFALSRSTLSINESRILDSSSVKRSAGIEILEVDDLVTILPGLPSFPGNALIFIFFVSALAVLFLCFSFFMDVFFFYYNLLFLYFIVLFIRYIFFIIY